MRVKLISMKLKPKTLIGCISENKKSVKFDYKILAPCYTGIYYDAINIILVLRYLLGHKYQTTYFYILEGKSELFL